MRTLKRTLSLALVLVMALGLMMSASAADFTDKADIQYAEGVEVMTGIGAINGYSDGSFAPDGLVTRGEAAKMIAYATLGANVAKNLSTTASSFTDVPAKLWSAPYIQYCVSKGIVSGRGNGKFDPNGNVTAYELGKMLLVAAGYGKNGEYVGASWSLNVAIDAFDKNIFLGSKDANMADAATREEAALYIFNTISKVTQVVFSADTKSYKDATTPAKTIGEQKYGLNKAPSTVNGVTGYIWKNTIGTALSGFVATDNVIGTSKGGIPMFLLTDKTFPLYISPVAADAKYYYNGTYISSATTTPVTLAVAQAAINKAGVIVNFINTNLDASAEVISITQKSVLTLAAAPVVKDGKVAITGICAATDVAKVVGYEGLAKSDVVLYYYNADTGIYYVEKATSVTGKMTNRTTKDGAIDGLIIGGTTYKNSGLVGDVITAYTTYNDTVAYLDNNGTIVKVEAVATAASTDYVVLLDSATITTGWANKFEAKVLLMDGTVKVVPFTKIHDDADLTDDAVTTVDVANAALENVFYTYTVDANGNYELTPVAAAGLLTIASSSSATITPKVAKFDATNVASSATTFIVNGTIVGKPVGTYATYTGIANVPSLTTANSKIIAVGGVATFVYIYSGTAVVTATPDVVYYINASTSTYYPAVVGVSDAYYEYAAIVKGESTKVKVAVAANANVHNGLWAVDYTNGIITNPNKTDKNIVGTGTALAANGIITLGGNSYTYDANTVVYFINKFGVVTKGTMAEVTVDANDTFTVGISAVPNVSADLIGELYITVND